MTLNLDHIVSLARLPAEAIPAPAMEMVELCLFDWTACGRAGLGEPVSKAVLELVRSEGGAAHATLFDGSRLPARAAALANGTISHALDYDDTHFAHIGHLSVAIFPAACAVAEEVDASAVELCHAYLVGAEAAVRLGIAFGSEHYQRGFHQTATAGAFGATIAAARLLRLTQEQTRHAIGIVSTRASGLKSQFGTMGKPFNAGVAASNGVEAAKLAASGFTSCDDGIFGPQGFIDTHCNAPDLKAAWADPPPDMFLFEQIKHKLHACCHGTHAMIDGLSGLLAATPLTGENISRLRLRVAPRWLRVCDKKTPRTGLEVKFSYAWLAGMIVTGLDTSSDRAFTDTVCTDPVLAAFAERVEVIGDDAVGDMVTLGRVKTTDGRHLEFSCDLASPMNRSTLQTGLRMKANDLIGNDVADRIWSATQ